MSKKEFIEKATDYGYDEESIMLFIQVVEEENIKYEDIFLIRKIVN